MVTMILRAMIAVMALTTTSSKDLNEDHNDVEATATFTLTLLSQARRSAAISPLVMIRFLVTLPWRV